MTCHILLYLPGPVNACSPLNTQHKSNAKQSWQPLIQAHKDCLSEIEFIPQDMKVPEKAQFSEPSSTVVSLGLHVQHTREP